MVARKLLGPIDRDRVTVPNQITTEFLLANQSPGQINVGLLDLVHINVRQKPVECILVGQTLQLGK